VGGSTRQGPQTLGFLARALHFGGLAFEDERPDTLAEVLASPEREE
jgi:hypothetical protein